MEERTMSGTEGRVMMSAVNALLALYGEPEPGPMTHLEDIAIRLNVLADQKRKRIITPEQW